MKSRGRRLLSVLMALVLCVGVLPAGVRAEASTTSLTVTFRDNYTSAQGMVQYSLDDGVSWVDVTAALNQQSIAVTGDQLRLKIVPKSGYRIDWSGITYREDSENPKSLNDPNNSPIAGGLSGPNGYYVTASATSVELSSVEFCAEDHSEEGQPHNEAMSRIDGNMEVGTVPEGTENSDYAGAEEWIESCFLAYYPGTGAADAQKTNLETYAAVELWNRGFSWDGRTDREGNPDPQAFCGIFGSFESFKSAISIGNEVDSLSVTDKTGGSTTSLTAYALTVTLPNEVTATNTVYALPAQQDFLVRAQKSSQETYYLVNGATGDGARKDVVLQIDYDENNNEPLAGPCGNAVWINGLDMGAEGLSFHITQEHSGLENSATGGVNCRLAIVKSPNALKITGVRSSASFDFQRIPYYDVSADPDRPPIAQVYYGNSALTVSNIDGKTISSIAAAGSLASTAVSYADGTLTLHTGYDEIPLVITFQNDNKPYYMILKRVGLGFSESQKMNGENAFGVLHGTDHYVKYAGESDRQIVATYYGDNADAVRVSVYVTVTFNDGRVERKAVNDTLKNGVVINMWDYAPVNSNVDVKLQGTDQYYADFLIWEGNMTQFESIIKIEVIVFQADRDGGFGGAKLGSGTGVEWSR